MRLLACLLVAFTTIASAAELATRDAMTRLYDHTTFQLVLRREVVAAADTALYRAKESGRDRTVVAERKGEPRA